MVLALCLQPAIMDDCVVSKATAPLAVTIV